MCLCSIVMPETGFIITAFYIHWTSRTSHSSSVDISWNTIKCFLQVEEGHEEQLVSSQVILLYLA